MKDFIPLIQTSLWVLFAIGLLIFLRKEIRLLRDILAQRLKAGSTLKLGPVEIGEMKHRIENVEKELGFTNEKIAQLFLATMAEPMYNNLKKIYSGSFGKYKMGRGLERELYHLRDIGYVEIESIKSIPEHGNNLSDYVKITNTGKEFIQLRELITKPES